MSSALFLVVAALTIACALVVILHRSPVYSAIGLVGALGQIAVLFLALDAQIVGFLQIIVYAGAIVVLFLFVIMLLNLQDEPEPFEPDPLAKRETLELVRAYYRIADPQARKRLFELTKALGRTVRKRRASA